MLILRISFFRHCIAYSLHTRVSVHIQYNSLIQSNIFRYIYVECRLHASYHLNLKHNKTTTLAALNKRLRTVELIVNILLILVVVGHSCSPVWIFIIHLPLPTHKSGLRFDDNGQNSGCVYALVTFNIIPFL